jgi:predicted dehydrogenase
MGALHLRALSRNATVSVVGVVDPSPPAWPGIPWEPDLAIALDKWDPQAVVVAVPPGAHASVARTCLSAGCDVLVEKPICPQVGEANRLAREFRNAGRVLFGGQSERFHPVFRALKSELERSKGWRSIRAVREGPSPQSVPEGGVILDLAVHDLDLALRLEGNLVLMESRELDTGSVRSLLGGLERRVEIVVGYQPLRRRTWEVECEGGTWFADLLARTLDWHPREGGRTPFGIDGADALEMEHLRFLEACRGGEWWSDLQIQIRAVDLAREIIDRVGGPPIES